MSHLIARIRQRKLVQWLAAYLAVAWGVIEVVDVLSGTWGWSSVVGRVTFVVLVTGLGIAGVLAWYHGERGRQRLTGAEGLVLALLVLLGGVATYGVVRNAADVAGIGPDDPGNVRSLAVLPFSDLSPEGGYEYLGDGIAETLINGLGRIDALRVVARTSAFMFKGQGLDLREVARRLGVEAVLEGSVVQAGGRVRITANLVDGGTGTALWADRFDRTGAATDLFRLQDDVARQILRSLEVELGGEEARVVREGSASQEAQRAYYLGQHHWTARTSEDIAEAASYFHQAIAFDSTFADAWAGLALAYVLHTPREYAVPGLTAAEALRRAEAAAKRSVELDSENAGAFVALADVRWQRGDLAGAEDYFRQAIALNPGNATAHHWLADVLMVQLRGEEALREIEIAESLSPVAPAILCEKAQAFMILGRYDEATAQLDKASSLLPDALLVRSYALWLSMRMEDWDRAAAHFRAAAEISGEPREFVDRVERGLRDTEEREAFLRLWLDQRVEELGAGEVLDIELLRRPELRFLAARELLGEEESLAMLEQIVKGPQAELVYAPIIPALLGPELLATEAGRRIMEAVARLTS